MPAYNYFQYWRGRSDRAKGAPRELPTGLPADLNSDHWNDSERAAWYKGWDEEQVGLAPGWDDPEEETAAQLVTVGILLPDGKVVGPEWKPKCERCGKELSWSRMDEQGADVIGEIGVLCWSCESDVWENY